MPHKIANLKALIARSLTTLHAIDGILAEMECSKYPGLQGSLREFMMRAHEFQQNTREPEILPGCWVETRKGAAVATKVYLGGWVDFRYEVTREGKTNWVSGTDRPDYVSYLREPDDVSREVLTLPDPNGDGYGAESQGGADCLP